MKKYKFSIITVVKNDPVNLQVTLESILSQKFQNFELIVIDGCSEDETQDVLVKFKEKIDILISEPDSGIYDAMNKGIKYSSGDWIHFLNAGDTFINDSVLENILQFTFIPNCNLLFTKYIKNQEEKGGRLDYFYLIKSMYCHQALFYKFFLFEDSMFDPKYRVCADYKHLIEKWYIIKKQYVPLVSINYLGGGISENVNNLNLIRKERYRASYSASFSLLRKIVLIFYSKLRILI